MPIQALTDSTACLGIVGRHGLGKLKHMQTQHLWLQDMVESGRIKIRHCTSAENLADVLTKQLPVQQLRYACEALGLHSLEDDS